MINNLKSKKINIKNFFNWKKTFNFILYGSVFNFLLMLLMWSGGWFTPCNAQFLVIEGPLHLPNTENKCRDEFVNADLVTVKQLSQLPNISEVKNASTQICDFKDGKWIDRDRFKTINANENYLRSPSKKNNEGAVMEYDSDIIPEFENIIKFLPITNDKVNVTHGYGNIFRAIIGEGSYNTFTLEKNINYALASKVNWEKVKELNSQLTRPQFRNEIVPKSEIESELKVGFQDRSNILTVEFIISYFPITDPNHKTNQSFLYNLELPVNPAMLKEKINVGLINPVKTKTSEVETKFLTCEISKK